MSKGVFTGLAIAIPIIPLVLWLGSYLFLRCHAQVYTEAGVTVRCFQLPDTIEENEKMKGAAIWIYSPLANVDRAMTGTHVVYLELMPVCDW